MRRSAVGAVLLLFAAVLLVAVPALRPSKISGIAQAAPVPGPPVVGDCVTDPIPYSASEIGIPSPVPGAFDYPSLTIGACEGPRFGEVVAVIAVPAAVTVSVDGDVTTVMDPNLQQCLLASRSYVGMLSTIDSNLAPWTPVTSAPTSASQPVPRQRAAGQNWIACLTYAPASIASQTVVNPYTGTLKNAVSTGYQSDQLGFCGATFSPQAYEAAGACTRPHEYQQLAVRSTGERTFTEVELTQTCAVAAKAVMGRAAGGDFTVVVAVLDSNGRSEAVTGDIPPNSGLQCGIAVTGDRLLGGSVVALGEKPIPWA